MAKFCKFCNAENEDTEEFCSKCSAKLPSYHQYAGGLMDEMQDKKKHSFKFNLKLTLQIAAVLAAVCLLLYFFKPSSSAEKLPDFRKNHNAVKNLMFFIDNLENAASDFDFNISVTADVLSLGLTSFIAPDAIDSRKSSPDIFPRIIVKIPDDDLKKITLVRHSKIYLLPVRLEINFKQNDSGTWTVNKWKFCNFPAMSAAGDSIWNKAVKNFKENKKLQKFFSLKSGISRTKSQIKIDIKNSAENAPKPFWEDKSGAVKFSTQ